jgi:hypothetical protein
LPRWPRRDHPDRLENFPRDHAQNDRGSAAGSLWPWSRGHVAGRLEGDAAGEVIDRITEKYTGQPYPLRSDRVVFLIEADHSWTQSFA